MKVHLILLNLYIANTMTTRKPKGLSARSTIITSEANGYSTIWGVNTSKKSSTASTPKPCTTNSLASLQNFNILWGVKKPKITSNVATWGAKPPKILSKTEVNSVALIPYNEANLDYVKNLFKVLWSDKNLIFTQEIFSLNPLPEKAKDTQVEDFRDFLQAIQPETKPDELRESWITRDATFKKDYPKLSGLPDIEKTRKRIMEKGFKGITKGDAYYSVLISIFHILNNKNLTSYQQERKKIEEITFQSHISWNIANPSLNYTGDTAKHLALKQEQISEILVSLFTRLKENDLDTDEQNCEVVLYIFSKFLGSSALGNYLILWCIDLYITSLSSNDPHKRAMTNLNFTLGRAVYKKTINVGHTKMSKDIQKK